MLCSQLGLANEEKAGLRKQVNELIARLNAIEKSNNENSNALMDTINELRGTIERQTQTVECYRQEIESMKKQLEAKDEVIKLLCVKSENLKLLLGNSRKHRYGRTSEQKRLLNNRNIDESALDKSEFDGSDKKDDKDTVDSGNGEGGSTSSGCESPQKGRTTRRKETSARAEKTRMKVDKIVTHEIDDYYQLPPGARIMNRNGMLDVWEYSVIEHVRAHNVEHVYKVVRVKLADGSFVNTMEHSLKNLGGVFSPELLARLLCLKYDFSMPENRQIRLLTREGIHISNTPLNCYIHNGISKLKNVMEDVFRKFEQQAKYLMVDETTELVGVKSEKGKTYRKKLAGPIMERIHHKVVMILGDTATMANELMRKAANYTINQWKSLRNIFKDGAAEILENLSLIESCKLNNIDPQDYLRHLFECILHCRDCNKEALLPYFYKVKMLKSKYFLPYVFILSAENSR